MIKSVLIHCSLILMFGLFSCGDGDSPDPIPSGKYESGVFVINQGKFGDGTGTISYYDRNSTVSQNIYQTENMGLVLGNIAQSMHVADKTAYIAINNAAKIEVVNADDFTKIATIEDTPQVRYMTSSEDNKTLYASSWGADGVSGILFEIDVESNEIISQTAIGGGLENMVIDGTELYVTKSGGFGTDSLVIQYDLSRSVVEKEFVVGDNPVGIVKDNEDDIWVLCTGAFDFAEPANNTSGGLYKIEGEEAILQLELANGSSNLAIDQSGNTIYYLDFEGIKSVDLNTLETSLFAAGSFYALGFDPVQNVIYASDAKDFASNGDVIILDQEGNQLSGLAAGIIPGGFYFTK